MSGSANLTVACVLRSGGDYDAEYVERLQAGVARHLDRDHEFICLSDVVVPARRIPLAHDWPGWWAKMEIFRPDLDGDLLCFDLDTLIVGDLAEIASIRKLTLLSDFFVPEYLASGVMYLPWFVRSEVWRRWIENPAGHMSRIRGHGDGGFLREVFTGRAARWQEELPGQIVSYKAHVRKAQHPIERGDGTVPENARVVCFHGRPRPREVGWML